MSLDVFFFLNLHIQAEFMVLVHHIPVIKILSFAEGYV